MTSAAAVFPFIIWTLQRTGGTNLTARLVELAGLKSAPHEPFNLGRIYGLITQSWQKYGDAEALQKAVETVAAKGEVIKHYVETVPWAVTEALIQASQAAGYRHLFLYRRNAVDRLLSLHFAKETGIWGPDMKAMKAQTGAPEIKEEAAKQQQSIAPLPVEKLLAHERRCVELLEATWQRLKSLGAQPAALAYEEVYRAPSLQDAQTALDRTLAALGIPIANDALPALTQAIVGQGDQGTRDKYREIPGYAELVKRAEQLPVFLTQARKPTWRLLTTDHPWLARAFVDVLPQWITEGQPFEIGGVVVLNREAPDDLQLVLRQGQKTVPLEWGIDSPRMAKEHPQAKNSAKARWRGSCHFDRGNYFAVIELLAPDQTRQAIIDLLIQPYHVPIVSEPEDRLIFDIGANDGADTAYYLGKGFRVVAVEAIPALAESLACAYRAHIDVGRLIVVNRAVSAQAGETELIINPNWTEWSSAHGGSKAKTANSQILRVPTVSLRELIESHGRAYYIKIDIEGGELDAVQSLQELAPEMLPPYLSFETNSRVIEVLQVLYDLGYRTFQLVRQGATYLSAPPYPSEEGLEYRVAFTNNMSGPFGRDLSKERWVGLVEVVRQIINSQSAMRERAARGEDPGWYDIHARLKGAA